MGTHRSTGSSSAGQNPSHPGKPPGAKQRADAAKLAGAVRAGLAPLCGRVVWCEGLEARQLLSAAHHAAPVAGATLAGGVVTVNGTNGADSVIFSEDSTGESAGGTLTVDLNGNLSNFPLAGVAQVNVFTLKGNDTVRGNNLTVPLRVVGGKGNQTFVGGRGNDTFITGKGNNVVRVGPGNDNVTTGSGRNRIILGAGNTTVNGKAGKNLIVRGAGQEKLVGSPKNNGYTTTAVPFVSTGQAGSAVPDTVFGTATGLTVQQVRNAYDFGNIGDPNFTNRGAGQAVAVVIPYNTPLITQSLTSFSTTFGLPLPDAAHFQIVTVSGSTPPSDPNANHPWETEAAADTEWVHAVAPEAKIYLVLANSSAFPDIFAAVDKAVGTLDANFGGGVVELSLGSQGGELDPASEAAFDASFSRPQAANISFVAASGDVGGVVSYPAVSPFVTAVGGTSLLVDANGNRTSPESAWSASGGGTSTNYPLPTYQQGQVVFAGSATSGGAGNSLGTLRTNPDVSADADPSTGQAVYDAQTFGDINADGVPDSGWLPGGAGGTSVAAAEWAGIAALANQTRVTSGRGFLGTNLNTAIYHVAETFGTEAFTDITTGAAGTNAAAPGYDKATGWGTPRATNLILRLAQTDVSRVNGNLTWQAFYRLPITQTGALQGPGEGFFVGNGTAQGGSNGVNVTFTPAANQPINYTLLSSGAQGSTSTASTTGGSAGAGTGSSYTGPYAAITNLTVGTLTRNDVTGKLFGTGTATVLVQVTTPVHVAPPAGGGGGPPSAGGGANTGGGGNGGGGSSTGGPGTTGTGGGTSGSGSGYGNAGTGTGSGYGSGSSSGSGYGNGSQGSNPFTTTVTTQLITVQLSVSGVSYQSASGKNHIRGSFVALDPTTGRPAQEGVATQFQGKFQADQG